MNKKILLQELCMQLEERLNIKSSFHQKKFVTLFCGVKPADYMLRQFHIGTTKTIPMKLEEAFYVEIIVDNIVIFRQSYHFTQKEDLQDVEDRLIEIILREVFFIGVMSSFDIITNLKNRP
jgi:hypothetical protein